nr:craniofacial development protein 2-like [Cherax quadricarinatus]
MIVDVMNEKKLDVLVLSETKLKGVGEFQWRGINGIRSGVSNRVRAKEGVAIMLKDKLWQEKRDYKCINSRIMWSKIKIGCEKWVIVSMYAPGKERSVEERERFWEMLGECVGSFESSVRVMVVGDFNAKVGKNVMEGVVGKFGVPGVNVNGEPLIELCVERDLVISNTYFMKKRINKYTRYDVARNESSLLDYVLVDKRLMGRLQDVHVYRGATDISDHYLVVATVKVRGRWEKRKVATTSKREVKVYKLREEEVRGRYKRLLAERWASAKMSSGGGVEEGWNSFKNTVLECGAEVCGYRRVGAGGKSSDWWNDEVKGVIKEKKLAYESKRKVKRV